MKLFYGVLEPGSALKPGTPLVDFASWNYYIIAQNAVLAIQGHKSVLQ